MRHYTNAHYYYYYKAGDQRPDITGTARDLDSWESDQHFTPFYSHPLHNTQGGLACTCKRVRKPKKPLCHQAVLIQVILALCLHSDSNPKENTPICTLLCHRQLCKHKRRWKYTAPQVSIGRPSCKVVKIKMKISCLWGPANHMRS
jgi:hypothetical protein